MKRDAYFMLIAAALSLLAACSTASVVTLVDSTVQAAEAAFPQIAAATGLSPAKEAQLMTYLQQADAGLSSIIGILTQGGSAATIATEITADLASVVAPDLTGVPSTVAVAIELVAKDVSLILATYGNTPSANASVKKGFAGKTFAPSPSDLSHLQTVKVRLEGSQKAVADWKLKHGVSRVVAPGGRFTLPPSLVGLRGGSSGSLGAVGPAGGR